MKDSRAVSLARTVSLALPTPGSVLNHSLKSLGEVEERRGEEKIAMSQQQTGNDKASGQAKAGSEGPAKRQNFASRSDDCALL